MDEQVRVQLSKAMSHALRHDPDGYGLSPDAAGWVAIEALVAGLRRHRRWSAVSAAELSTVVGVADKRRFEMEGDRIRAGYGHSLPGRISQLPQPPPELLYHGTAPETVPRIVDTGLLAMRRQYVHLSTSVAVARSVGGRRAVEPVVFVVAAGAAHAAGVGFYAATDPHTWLADAVPPEYLSVLAPSPGAAGPPDRPEGTTGSRPRHAVGRRRGRPGVCFTVSLDQGAASGAPLARLCLFRRSRYLCRIGDDDNAASGDAGRREPSRYFRNTA